MQDTLLFDRSLQVRNTAINAQENSLTPGFNFKHHRPSQYAGDGGAVVGGGVAGSDQLRLGPGQPRPGLRRAGLRRLERKPQHPAAGAEAAAAHRRLKPAADHDARQPAGVHSDRPAGADRLGQFGDAAGGRRQLGDAGRRRHSARSDPAHQSRRHRPHARRPDGVVAGAQRRFDRHRRQRRHHHLADHQHHPRADDHQRRRRSDRSHRRGCCRSR